MAHGHDEDLEEGIGPQEIDAGPVSLVVVLGAASTLVLIFMTIMFYNYMASLIKETKGLDEPNDRVATTAKEQRKSLDSYEVVDAAKKTVSMPVGKAMAMIVEQRTKDPNPKVDPNLPMASKQTPATGGDAKKDAKAPDAKGAGDKKEEPKKDAKGK